MSYTVNIQSKISLTDAIGATRADFNLPLTELKAANNAQYPSKFSTLIRVSTSTTFDLSNIGFNLRALAIKATRPVATFLVTADKEYELPLGTYACYLFDSKESSFLTNVTAVRVEVPAASSPNPTPAPANYPDAFVDLFVLTAPV